MVNFKFLLTLIIVLSSLNAVAVEGEESADLEKEYQQKVELLYQNFAAAIDRHSKDSNTSPLKVMMDSYIDLKNRYIAEQNKRMSENLLWELDTDLDRSIRFAKERNDSFGLKYFSQEKKFVDMQFSQKKQERNDELHQIELDAFELMLSEFKNKIYRFTGQVQREKNYKKSDSFNLGETVIEISVRDLVVSHKSGNVSYIAPKSYRKKVYGIKIITPSKNSNFAVLKAAETLLANPYVEGIFYDDWLRIPTGLKNYTTSPFGANVLVRANKCMGLFL